MAVIWDIFRTIDDFAPFDTQMDFDNAGFLVGRGDSEVTKVLVALDITLPVVREAEAAGAQLIVSHHPVIFGSVRRLTDESPEGEVLLSLAEKKIAAICAHTNLDVAVDGVNDALAKAIGLQTIRVLQPESIPDRKGRVYGLGRVGELPEAVTAVELARVVKEKLGAAGVRLTDGGRPVKRVAVGGGACGECLKDAFRAGCDLLVTADVKYHTFLEAKARGISLMDAGHYATEQVVLPGLAQRLSAEHPEVEVLLSRAHKEVCICI